MFHVNHMCAVTSHNILKLQMDHPLKNTTPRVELEAKVW